MSDQRLFLDTVFVQALLKRRDQYHRQAVTFALHLRTAAEVWVTEAVLTEIANALSSINRAGAVRFIWSCYQTSNTRVVAVTTDLFQRGLQSSATAAQSPPAAGQARAPRLLSRCLCDPLTP